MAGRKHRQPLVEANYLQFVQPQQSAVQQPGGVPDTAFQNQIRLNRLQQFAKCGLGQHIHPPDAGTEGSR